jgi:hypothetical protein
MIPSLAHALPSGIAWRAFKIKWPAALADAAWVEQHAAIGKMEMIHRMASGANNAAQIHIGVNDGSANWIIV